MFTTSFAAPDRFLSTLPARGATRDTAKQLGVSQFLSTLPARGATALGLNFGPCFRQFLSTLPARGATGRRAGLLPAPPISIHAPREGSDGCSRLLLPRPTDFYPRSPRGERPGRPPSAPGCRRFLSTLPARGATEHLHRWDTWNPFLSTLPARGATVRRMHGSTESRRFLSTLPARGATDDGMSLRRPACISIHAPREGSDSPVTVGASVLGISIHAPREGSDQGAVCIGHPRADFYPRSPRGERPSFASRFCTFWLFLSTLPARGAT